MGFEDYAGSGIIHAVGGAASLAATYITGPRQGRFDKEGKMRHMAAHSMPVSLTTSLIIDFWRHLSYIFAI